MRWLTSLILIGTWHEATARKFRPRNNARLSEPANFLRGALPCRSDALSFSTSGNEPMLAVMDISMDISEVQFPSLGVIYLTGDGQLGGWDANKAQCVKRHGEKEVSYFNHARSDQDVFDPATWTTQRPPKAFELHMNQVPGGADTVEVSADSLIHFKLYEELQVKEWIDFGRKLTTDDFTKRLRTLEGQISMQLGNKLSHEVDVGNIAFKRPNDEPIRVGDFKGSYHHTVFGATNPNIENETLTAICARVHCNTEAERPPPKCLDLFIPKGHCCPVCGALIEVQTDRKAYYEVELIVESFNSDYKKSKNNLEKIDDRYHFSMERVDETDMEFRYQMLWVVKDNATYVDGDELADMVALFKEKLAPALVEMTEEGENSKPVLLLSDAKISQRDHSFDTVSIVAGCLVFFIALVFCIFYFFVEARNQARFLYRRARAEAEILVAAARGLSRPVDVEMSTSLLDGREAGEGEGGGKGKGAVESDLLSECESGDGAGDAGKGAVSFSNMAFSMASLDEAEKAPKTVAQEQASEAEHTETLTAREADEDRMSPVDLL